MSQTPPPPPPPPAGGPPWGSPGPGPYAAGPSGPRGSFGARLAGWLIDVIIVGIPANLLALAARNLVLGYILSIVLRAAYEIYLVGSPSGQTVGMRAMGIRVLDTQTGGPIDPGRAALRWLVSLVSGFACFIGYLWMLWDPEKQTWHDKAAGTYVVPTSYYPVERWPG